MTSRREKQEAKYEKAKGHFQKLVTSANEKQSPSGKPAPKPEEKK